MSKSYKNRDINLDAAYVEKLPVKGRIVAVLDLEVEEKNLHFIDSASRALKRNGIYELTITADKTVKSRCDTKHTKYLCFFEVVHGGIALRGDIIVIGDEKEGELIGFDRAHMPNHLNIVVTSEKWKTGKEMNLFLNQEVKIVKPS